MRYRDLFEAPLADFDAFGDLDTAGSFRKDDLRAIRNPKWREKVYKAFQRTPFNFNIYVYNGPEGMAPVGQGADFAGSPLKVNDLSNLKKYVGVQPMGVVRMIIGKIPPDAAESITVLLVENEGAERIALTPWILAHRVAHALIYAGQERGAQGYDRNIAAALEQVSRAFGTMMKGAESALRASPHHADSVKSDNETERMRAVAKLIGTFRSARTGDIRDRGEFMVELLTQYLVKGAITLNRPVMDDKGATPAAEPGIDQDLLELARKYRKNEDGFVKEALRTKYRFASRPKDPSLSADTYEAYNAEGQMVATFNVDHLISYRSRPGIARIEKAPPPSKQAVARWNTYQQRKKELGNMFRMFWARDLVFPEITKTDGMSLNLAAAEENLNTAFSTMLSACVGKALVL